MACTPLMPASVYTLQKLPSNNNVSNVSLAVVAFNCPKYLKHIFLLVCAP